MKKNRGISFEDVMKAVAKKLLDVRQNKNFKHGIQKVFIVDIRNYPWVVPFYETEEEIFLITAFPDRKLKEEFGYED